MKKNILTVVIDGEPCVIARCPVCKRDHDADRSKHEIQHDLGCDGGEGCRCDCTCTCDCGKPFFWSAE